MDIKGVRIDNPEGLNFILGQSHFIKTIEDIHEALVGAVPGILFGAAFCESSGPCLVRTTGTDSALIELAANNALKLAAGHSFIIFLRDAFPVNVLNAVKAVSEVCGVYCATANPVEVVMADNGEGRGILGVIDGLKSNGIEGAKDKEERKAFLRKIGYKL